MVNSKDIAKLRPDVAANCRLWLARCQAAGLDVAISNTLRDNEYQAKLYAQGRTTPGKIVTNSKTTTFHGQGLAIDFYSKSSGWSDHSFFKRCGAIAKELGFSWAGDWKSFVEYCHIQWDNHRKSGHLNAPNMPLYKEEIELTKAELEAMVAEAVKAAVAREVPTAVAAAVKDKQPPVYTSIAEVPAWARALVRRAVAAKVLTGDAAGKLHLSTANLVNLQMLDNLGLINHN